MILAGVDEVGYGPLLGPLVVASCAVRLPDVSPDHLPATDGIPDLWTLWERSVSRTRCRRGRLHVNDSKAVYTPKAGIAGLERGVLAVARAVGDESTTFDALLAARTAGVPLWVPGDADPAAPPSADHPWYAAGDTEPHPAAAAEASVRLAAHLFGRDVHTTGCRVLSYDATVAPERRLNLLLNATRNKAAALFSLTARHLDHLIRLAAGDGRGEPILIVADRLGGRSRYGPLLRQTFPDLLLTIDAETETHAAYRLNRRNSENRPDVDVRLMFREKADVACWPTAGASMLGKYLRERLMGRLNAWWASRVPGLTPTAGYWTDGQRFLGDIDDFRRSARIPDNAFVRCR